MIQAIRCTLATAHLPRVWLHGASCGLCHKARVEPRSARVLAKEHCILRVSKILDIRDTFNQSKLVYYSFPDTLITIFS